MAEHNKKKIIDVETLEVWESVVSCAEALGVSSQAVLAAIVRGGTCGGPGYWAKRKNNGRRLEYFDYWNEVYTPEEKERFTKKNNIFWL